MDYSKTGVALTESFEGCRLVAYMDSKGVWTIGYGHTSGVKAGDTCTQAQAEAWLIQDIAWAVKQVNLHVSISLNQNEFDALVDFTFNVGVGNLASSTLLRMLNDHDLEGCAKEFLRWSHCNGVEVAGLLRRRQAESDLFLRSA